MRWQDRFNEWFVDYTCGQSTGEEAFSFDVVKEAFKAGYLSKRED